MFSDILNSRIQNLFIGHTLNNSEATINYLLLLERFAERHNMIDVADHAQIARINLSRRVVED